jgi:RNA polymerase sigma-70 factor (TIGR02960 family)
VSADLEPQLALTRARGGDEQAFRQLVEPCRRELQSHCYRMLGSTQDAEDLVQEALLSAWRGLDGFREGSSFRSWLYAIATNACLSALRRERRRREIAPPPEPPGEPPPPSRTAEAVWLEPYPDSLLEGVPDRAPGPDARYGMRESIELAFIAALQRLPPGQRAVLVLRDVLGFRAAEAAAILGSSEDSVTSALRRARASVDDPRGPEEVALPGSPAERELVGRFADAFESGDVTAVVALLSEDARLTMPPEPFEYHGRAAIAGFLSTVPAAGALERFRLVPTRANGAPAFGCYLLDPHGGPARAYGLMVLTVGADAVTAITGFPDTSVFRCFGLPRTLPQ